MNKFGELIESSRKIVIKIGSNVLSDDEGHVNCNFISNIAEQIDDLCKLGKQIVIVSSGAGICGVGAIHKWSRRGDLNYKQALCAIGQVELMNSYKEYFSNYGRHVGQILITRDDFTDHQRELNIRNTLFTLVDEGVIPIINENDSVSTDEITFGDNDTLGALTAKLWNADLLMILSDIDGVFDKNPKEHGDALLIEEVYETDKLLDKIDTSGKSSFGTGGIDTKICAASKVNDYGIPVMLANGKNLTVIRDLLAGKSKGTIFYCK